MAAPPLLRGLPLLRLRQRLYHHRLVASASAGVSAPVRRPLCSSATESTRSELFRVKDPPIPKLFGRENDDPAYRKWKDKEEEILQDIEHTTLLVKEILHSQSALHTRVWKGDASEVFSCKLRRYMDGERLTADDERYVVEKLLAYHPHSEDKIGCGLDSIMVDRHPRFRHSRCLFVVRTDGGWIDFSYQKCLREYVRNKYPSHAERFIREHWKRGSGS